MEKPKHEQIISDIDMYIAKFNPPEDMKTILLSMKDENFMFNFSTMINALYLVSPTFNNYMRYMWYGIVNKASKK